jgi:hypothetical protein
MLPLSPIEIIAFFFATLLAARLMATQLPASIASYAVVGFVFALWYFGPLLCGEEWSDVGLFLGVCIGGFGHMAYERQLENGDREQKKADLRSRQVQAQLILVLITLIALVVMFAIGR